MKDLINGFKEFVLRGNVLDLAVAVVVGAAFTTLVNSMVADIITPLIGAFGGVPDFSGLTFTINGSEFRYGLFINAVIAFLIIALVLYFLIIRPMNILMARAAPKTEAAVAAVCPNCLSPCRIRSNALRGMHLLVDWRGCSGFLNTSRK